VIISIPEAYTVPVDQDTFDTLMNQGAILPGGVVDYMSLAVMGARQFIELFYILFHVKS